MTRVSDNDLVPTRLGVPECFPRLLVEPTNISQTPLTCSVLTVLETHPSPTRRFYGAAANRGYSGLRSSEGIREAYILTSTCRSYGESSNREVRGRR